jgi:hypothetical protein
MSVTEINSPKKRLEYIFDETSRGNGAGRPALALGWVDRPATR